MRRAIEPGSIRAFIQRDWEGARKRKREYWRRRLDEGGLREALDVTQQLRSWMMSADAGWPTQAQREEDLAARSRARRAR